MSVSTGSIGPVPASMFVTLNTGLIGQPALASQSLAAVGPSVEAGSPALADSGNSLLPSIRYGSAIDWSKWLVDEENIVVAEVTDQLAAPDDIAVVQAKAAVPVRLDPEADRVRADERGGSGKRSGWFGWARGCKDG